MSYQTYSLTRVLDGDRSEFAQSFTTSDDDAINCAHMLAAGFNTMSRNFMHDWVVGVVDTKAGTVQYDGKIEKFDRADKRRDMLESAYAELERVKNVLFAAGVETIPADAGVTDLRAVLRARDVEISELVQERANANAAARAELIKYVRGAYLKKERLTVDEVRQDLEDRFRGVLDVLAKFLVVTGEADASEGHAVARRLCGIDDA